MVPPSRIAECLSLVSVELETVTSIFCLTFYVRASSPGPFFGYYSSRLSYRVHVHTRSAKSVCCICSIRCKLCLLCCFTGSRGFVWKPGKMWEFKDCWEKIWRKQKVGRKAGMLTRL